MSRPATDSRLKQPIFICGCHRSGTSLVREILNQHPEIDILPETKLGAWFWNPFKPIHRRNRDKLLDELETNLPRINRAWHKPENSFRLKALAKARHQAREDLDSFSDLMAYLLKSCCRPNAKFVGEKTPLHIYHLPQLRKKFPNARFIIMERDLRGAIHSQEQRQRRANLSYRPFRRLPFVAAWRHARVLADDYQRQFGIQQIHRLSFEDLVTFPKDEIRKLCEFLAVPYNTSMTEVKFENSSFSETTATISSSPATRWENELSPAIQASLAYLGSNHLASPVDFSASFRLRVERFLLRVSDRVARAFPAQFCFFARDSRYRSTQPTPKNV